MTRKDYWRFAAAFALAAGLSGCGGSGGGDGDDMMPGDTDEPSAMMIEAARPEPARLGEIMDGETVSGFVALGARQLNGAEIRAELVGVTLDEVKGGWTWNIGDDGMASSRADDNSWTSASIWEIRNDQYCRGMIAPDSCSTVYELDGVYRFTDSQGQGEELSTWGTVVQKALVVDDAEALAVAIDRFPGSQTTTALDVSNMKVNAREDGGFTISYTLAGGQEQTYELALSDLGSDPANPPFIISKRDGAGALYFWSRTGSFLEEYRDYSYFDLGGWTIFGYEDMASDVVLSQSNGNIAYGYRTPVDGIPSGSATFTGQMGALGWDGNAAGLQRDSTTMHYRGPIELTASFDDMTVQGAVSGLESRPGGGNWSGTNATMTFNATIDGNGFSAADLAGTGDLAGYANGTVNGAFYGPAAEEAGGVFAATDGASNRHLTGWFGAEQPLVE